MNTTLPVRYLRPSRPSSLTGSWHRSASRSTSPLRDNQPNRKQFFGYSSPLKIDLPEWMPIDNYQPASSPLTSPRAMPMALGSEFTAKLPALPSVSPTQAKPRQRGSKAEDRKPDFSRLYAAYSLNPLSSALAKSSKCVLTADWRVAQQEMRFIRAMERIEAKKQDERWSLRQPRKLRGATVPKAHWDYLLEEMVRLEPYEIVRS